VVIEDNEPYVKIIFPADRGSLWDGNALNNQEKDTYAITKSGEAYSVNGLSFERSAMVEQEDNDDPIVFTDLRTEIYGQGAGLVSKETTQLHYCTRQVCDRIIESGVVLKQKIKEYGVH
jgi:hypothetical protein